MVILWVSPLVLTRRPSKRRPFWGVEARRVRPTVSARVLRGLSEAGTISVPSACGVSYGIHRP